MSVRARPLGLSFVAAVETWWLTRRSGVWITPDGAGYLSAAHNLTNGRGLTLFDGSHLSLWPPGFPVVIASIHWVTGLPVESAARFVNIALAAIITFLTWLLARRHLSEGWATAVTVALLLPATGLTWITVEAWSEPLATAFLLGTVLLLERSWGSGEIRWGALLAAGLLAAAGGLTRYSGLFVVAGGALALLLGGTRQPRRATMWSVAVFGALGVVPTGLWLFHVWRLTGSPTGPRVAAGTHLADVVHQLGSTVGSWLLPGADAPGAALWVGLIALIVCGVLVVVVGRRARRSIQWHPRPLECVIVVYLGGVLGAAILVRLDPIGPRLLAPALPGALVLIASAVRVVGPFRLPQWSVAFAGVAVVVWAGYAVRSTVRSPSLGNVVSYASPVWRTPVDEALAHVASHAELWSDAPDAVWVAQHRSARPTPERIRSFAAHSPAQQVHAFRNAIAGSHNGLIVWIDDQRGRYLFTPDQLAKFVGLRLLAAGDGWAVYQALVAPPR